jgi:hypothetical protein
VLGLCDDEVSATASHRARFPQDDSDVIRSVFDAPFRFGDDLLRDDHNVAVLQPPGALDRFAEQRGEVVTGRNLRKPGQRQNPKLAQNQPRRLK